MSKFKVGDRVRIVRGTISGPPADVRVGDETIVVSDLIVIDGILMHRLNERGFVYATPECLEPIYDGHEKTSWSECAWKPNQVRA